MTRHLIRAHGYVPPAVLRAVGAAALTFIVVLFVSYAAGERFVTHQATRMSLAINQQADQALLSIERQINAYRAALQGLGAVMAATGEPAPEDFEPAPLNRYADALRPAEYLPGLAALTFNVDEPGPEHHHSVRWSWPARNDAALTGGNLWRYERLRNAIRRAQSHGFALSLPLRSPGPATDRRHLLMFVRAPGTTAGHTIAAMISVRELLDATVSHDLREDMALRIVALDGTPVRDGLVMAAAFEPEAPVRDTPISGTLLRTADIGNQQWELSFANGDIDGVSRRTVAGVSGLLALLAAAAMLLMQIRRHRNHRALALVAQSSDCVLTLDHRLMVREISPSARRITGRQPQDWLNRPLFDSIDEADRERLRRLFHGQAQAGGNVCATELRAISSGEGRRRWLSARIGNHLHDPTLGVIMVQLSDIHAIKRSAEALTQEANQDALTGLPNRRHFISAGQKAIAQASRRQEPLAVLMIDLNRFKEVNDQAGHAEGDLVLRHVAQRLIECTRDGDMIARLGGDEFGAIIASPAASEEAQSAAMRIRLALGTPLRTETGNWPIGASIGISIYPMHGSTIETLLEAADRAMYESKREHSLMPTLAADPSAPGRAQTER